MQPQKVNNTPTKEFNAIQNTSKC